VQLYNSSELCTHRYFLQFYYDFTHFPYSSALGEDADKAVQALNGSKFRGKVLHIEPALQRRTFLFIDSLITIQWKFSLFELKYDSYVRLIVVSKTEGHTAPKNTAEPNRESRTVEEEEEVKPKKAKKKEASELSAKSEGNEKAVKKDKSKRKGAEAGKADLPSEIHIEKKKVYFDL
jgi:RNA recognition motif-containing protein